jgi:hypothetical protein
MYSGSIGSTSHSQLEPKFGFLRHHYGALTKKKTLPLQDMLFMFGVLGSLYTLVLAEKFIF